MQIDRAGVHEDVRRGLVHRAYQPAGGLHHDLDRVVARTAQAGTVARAAPGPVEPVPTAAQHSRGYQALRGLPRGRAEQ